MSQSLGPMSGREQPSRDSVAGMDRLSALNHPLASNLVTLLRDTTTAPPQFETAIHEVTRCLLWKATQEEPVDNIDVSTFSGSSLSGTRFSRRIAAFVILRAGLSMAPPVRTLIPEAPIYQVGIKRDESILEPQLYYSNLPTSFTNIDHLMILDPMLATGGSARMALQLVRTVFTGDVSFLGLIGAPLGVATLLETDPNLRVYLASLDERLDSNGYIVPGLGDAGDRVFGTN